MGQPVDWHWDKHGNWTPYRDPGDPPPPRPERESRSGGPFLWEAFNTFCAPRWKLWCARAFGARLFVWDGLYHVTLAEWRGKRYLISFREDVSGGGR